MTSSKEKHWVEDLFPPNFQLSLDELLAENLAEQSTLEHPIRNQKNDGSREDKSKNPSIFAKAAQQSLSPLDVSAIKNVYERVWLMTHLEAEKKQQLEEAGVSDSDISSHQRSSSLTASLRKSRDDKTKTTKRHASTSTTDINDLAPLDVHDESLWNSNEIAVLREVFKAAKEQNRRLQAQYSESQHQNQKLEAKSRKQAKALESRIQNLKDATKANERLSILSNNLQQQVLEATGQISGLRTQVKSLQQQRSEMLKDTHELRVSLDREMLDRKKVELELQSQTQEAFREEHAKRANLKALHDEDIQFLQKTIDDLTDTLKRERTDHDRTKRGLNHLRQHFSSLPLHSQSQANIVKDDQLKQWTY